MARQMAKPVARSVLQQVMLKHMSEDNLLQAVVEAASLLGWRWHHIRRSDKAVQMGHAGFPDLLLVREHRLVSIELKTHKGRVTPEQQEWLDALRAAGVQTLVIRPSDLDWLLRWLR